MSTEITPSNQNIEIVVTNDVIDINVTTSVVDINTNTEIINIEAAGTYPLPATVYSVFGRTGAIVATLGDYNTSLVTENTNLYFTNARSRNAISLTTLGTSGAATYDNATGIFNIPQYQGGVTSFNTRTGAITLLSADVTGALGFTPYNDTNPAGYISGITSGMVTTALGYTPVTNARTLTINGTTYDLTADRSWTIATGSGTVTSVGLSAPTGFSVTNSPITTSGTLALGFASGYSLPTNVKQSNWDDAYTFVAAFPTQTGNAGKYLTTDGSVLSWATNPLGTVTSVAVTESGDALTITGSPITTSGTINIGFAGTTAQYVRGDGSLATFPSVAQEAQRLITEVYNNSGATLTKGTVVYINGGQGNLPTVTKALATGDATSAQTYGIVQTDITNMNNGFVIVIGSLSDLDTQAYAVGTQLYLSSTVAGAWTSVKQYAPAHLVYVGIVVRSHPTQGVVEVRIQNGFELDELHDVSAQNPTNGDILQYVASTDLWTKTAGTTTNISEGTNLYYTDARSRSALSFAAGSGAYNSTTGVITIPTNNNQITNGSNYITLASLSAGTGISYNNTTGVITNSAPDQTVSLTSGAGISVSGTYPSFTIASTITQYTDALARAAISGGTGISYNSTSGVITNTITQYTDALARASISLTTTGTSGAATYNNTTGVLNIPQYSGGGGGSISLAAIGSTPNANAATLTGTVLNLEPASASFGGVVTTGTQTFAGQKNFSGQVVINGTAPLNNSNLTVIQSGSNFAFTCQASTSKTSTSQSTLFILSSNEPIASNPQTLIFAYTGAATLANRYFGFQTGESGIANGGNLVFQQAAGNVGIATTTVGSKLQVNGNAAIGYSASTAAPANGLAVSGNTTIGGDTLIGTNNNPYRLTVALNGGAGYIGVTNQTGTTGDRLLRMGFGSGLTYATIQGTRLNTADDVNIVMQLGGGNLGVATSTIGSKLQVNGNAAIGYSASTAAPTNGMSVAGTVNVGTNTSVTTAALQVSSTTQGFLPPKMTTTQKNAIVTPAAGLIVYDTTLNKLCVYTTAWETITSL